MHKDKYLLIFNSFILSIILSFGLLQAKNIDLKKSITPTFETFVNSYKGDHNEEAHTLIVLKDGYLLGGYSNADGHNSAHIVKIDLKGDKVWERDYSVGLDIELKSSVAVKDGFIFFGSVGSTEKMKKSMYALKIKSNGDEVWENYYAFSKNRFYTGNSIAKANNNNLIIVGSSNEGLGVYNYSDGCMHIIDIDGKKIFSKHYSGFKDNAVKSVVKLDDGFIFAGLTSSEEKDNTDLYVAKIDENGIVGWRYTYGTKFYEVTNKIIQIQNGGYIILGATRATKSGKSNIYLVRIDEDGILDWKTTFKKPEDENAFDIIEVKDGYIMTGYTEDTKDTQNDLLILKIDKKGHKVWRKTYGDLFDDSGYSITKIDGGIIISGYITSLTTLSREFYLLKVDENGSF